MNLLITGASGQLGQSLLSKISLSDTICLTPDRNQLNVSDYTSVKRYFSENRIDAVVHAAAFTAVDWAEKTPDICEKVNALGTKYIAEECEKHNSYLIYLSTDYVFDGNKENGYFPEDKTNPISVYGKTKQLGEEYTMKTEHNLVIRTSWLFGKYGKNFVDSISTLALQKNSISVVCDQKGCPTYADDLALLISRCLKIHPKGILHAVNEGVCTRSDFAREILSLQKINCNVVDVLSEEYPSAARRPKNSVLDTSCLDKWDIPHLPHWRDALKRYLLDGGRVK